MPEAAMTLHNPLLELKRHGQSIWLDYIERRILNDGTLSRMIREDGLAGMPSNPAIFEKAIDHTDDYRSAIAELAGRGAGTEEIYEELVIDDVRRAAGLFREVYDATGGADGYVSLEVSPLLADDNEATIAEARRLWALLDSPNTMIKVPATRAGLPALERLIRDGINVNVTLLFSVGRYVEVIDAFMAGLEGRAADGQPLDRVASVASFFLSRIDSKVDPLLDTIGAGGDPERAAAARQLRGRTAIASAGQAYHRFQEHFRSPRWGRLEALGARRQRLLWASTSTKDPAYDDLKYVEPLIGADTVNTLPVPTLEAYRAHGEPALRLPATMEGALPVLKGLQGLGIDLGAVDQALEREGVRKFVEPFRQLLETLDAQRRVA
jgi:transaldolase